jgi:TRAP-type C4-dicarboxylate transport system permease small subunit
VANIIGTMIYLRAVSPSWAIPEERVHGMSSVTGEPFVWAAYAVPIFAGFGLLNLVWGAYICVKRNWRDGYLLLAITLIWLVAVWIDFAHH